MRAGRAARPLFREMKYLPGNSGRRIPSRLPYGRNRQASRTIPTAFLCGSGIAEGQCPGIPPSRTASASPVSVADCLAGGFASAVLERWADDGLLRGQRIRRLGIGDAFVEHGSQAQLRELVGLRAPDIIRAVRELILKD